MEHGNTPSGQHQGNREQAVETRLNEIHRQPQRQDGEGAHHEAALIEAQRTGLEAWPKAESKAAGRAYEGKQQGQDYPDQACLRTGR